MKLYFFYNNPPVSNTDFKDFCFLWYQTGLVAYKQIDTIVSIEIICVEDNIYLDFQSDYPEMFNKYKIERVNNTIKQPNLEKSNKVSFLASNDTIFYLMRNTIELQGNASLFAKKGEGAKASAEKLGHKCIEISTKIPDSEAYTLLVMGNDWGLIEQKINSDFLNASKNSICIQESVIDFNPVDQRMMYCSLPIFQGIVSLKNMELKGKVIAVIGNPRYEQLKQTALPIDKKVLINVNFTYGIFEEIRESWLRDILSNCDILNVEYLISQHPRDMGDLKKYNLVQTNAESVHDILRSCSILITRFSSLIHESLLLGRPVIYYNPHGEDIFYDFEPDNKCLFIARTKEELLLAMKAIMTDRELEYNSQTFSEYLTRHLGVTKEGNASNYINDLINKSLEFDNLKKISVKRRIILNLKVFKRRLLNQKI